MADVTQDRVRIELWSPEDTAARAADIWAVYKPVFGDVESEEGWRASTLDRHRARLDFRFAAALSDDELVGFAYGYVGERGQYWPDRVASMLPEIAGEWVGGHFEFVELGVLAAHRRQGIGMALHDAVMTDIPSDRALLGTDADESAAVRLYRSRGWQTLGVLAPDVQVMGWRA